MIAKAALGVAVFGATLSIGLTLQARGTAEDTRDAAAKTLVEQDAQCERGGLVNADRIIDTRDPDDSEAERRRVETLFPIRDCGTRPRRPLPIEQQREFVRLVKQCRVPIVVNHAVIGGRPGRCTRKFLSP